MGEMNESQKMDLILQELGEIRRDVQAVKEDVQRLKERALAIEITLENETNKNIMLIAEENMGLERKLNEVLKGVQPNVLHYLQVNHLDSEVVNIKRVLNMA